MSEGVFEAGVGKLRNAPNAKKRGGGADNDEFHCIDGKDFYQKHD